MAAWLPAAIAGGGSVLSALLGRDAQGDYYDNVEQTLENNYRLALRSQEEQEAMNEFIRSLATAPTTNLRGDRTFYEEGAGWQIDPTQYTRKSGALTDALAGRQLDAAQGIQDRALRAREDQQQSELGLADSLMRRMESRTPMTASSVMDAQNAQEISSSNKAYDQSIEQIMGRLGSGSNPASIISDLNDRRADQIRTGSMGLPEARSAASSLDTAEMSNLSQQYGTMADRGTAQLPVGQSPETALMQALMSGRALAPQTLGQIRTPIVPQQGIPQGPDFSDALAAGSVGDAISGVFSSMQAGDRWQQLMDVLMQSGGRTPNIYDQQGPSGRV